MAEPRAADLGIGFTIDGRPLSGDAVASAPGDGEEGMADIQEMTVAAQSVVIKQPHAKKWEVGWASWLVVGVFGSFALLEARAIMRDEPTLSQTVWHIQKGFPPFAFLNGFVVGFLANHFYWPDQGLKSDGHDGDAG